MARTKKREEKKHADGRFLVPDYEEAGAITARNASEAAAKAKRKVSRG